MEEEMKDPAKLKEMMSRKGDRSESVAAINLGTYAFLEGAFSTASRPYQTRRWGRIALSQR
jgi:hypothetical protein